MENYFTAEFAGLSQNEQLARAITAGFILSLDPTVEEMAELKTAVSEAVTNAVVHAYPESNGRIFLEGRISGGSVYITVRDEGIGIEDIEKARTPLYTAKPEEERSGLGFSIMESFCDRLRVESRVGKGTTVELFKKIGGKREE
jgi:stage II sporulation protein AB (anti-sigma F factor)